MPHSLERTESSLVPYDSARYWRNVNTPPGSNPSSLTSATGPAAGRMHGFMEGNVACAVHPSVPMNDSTRVPSAALYTSAYGSGNTGTATHSHSHSAGTSVQSSQAGSCSINGGSLLERNESIVAYYVRQRNLSITDTVLGSESSDTVSPRNCSAAPLSCRSQAQGRGNHLKPCLSPKSRGAASPASGYTDGEGSNKEVNLGIGMSPGSILPPVLELPPTTQQQQSASASTRQSLSPNPAAQTTGGSSGPHDPTEVPGPVNELCMEPPDRPQSTGHPDDQHQFQYQYQQHPPQVLYRTPSAAPHSRGVSPSWFQAPQVQIVVTSPTDVTGAGPSLSPHPPRLSPINLQGNHQAFLQPNGQYLVPSMQVTHLPGNALHIMPVYVQSPSLVHSQASSQQNDGGSLCFSQTDSPYLQGINIGGGGGSEDDPRQGPHYHEDSLLGSSTHSSATSQLSIGIGLTREELNRGFGPAGGGAGGQQQGARQGQDYVTPFAVRAPPRNGSNPPSPQLRNPRPTRPTAVAVRNLGGFDSPSQQRSALDNQSSGSSFERGTNSFSPSFIAGLDTERDSYLQHPDYQYQHQQHNRSNSSQQQHPQYYQQYQMPFPPPSPQQQHHLQQQQVKQQHQHQYQGGDAMAYAAAGMHPYSQQQQQRAARAGAVSTPERQEAARANALIRDDTRKEKY